MRDAAQAYVNWFIPHDPGTRNAPSKKKWGNQCDACIEVETGAERYRYKSISRKALAVVPFEVLTSAAVVPGRPTEARKRFSSCIGNVSGGGCLTPLTNSAFAVRTLLRNASCPMKA